MDVDGTSAALVMTHHYLHDRSLLRFLLPSAVRFIGILGPRRRTESLLGDLERGGPLLHPRAARATSRARRARHRGGVSGADRPGPRRRDPGGAGRALGGLAVRAQGPDSRRGRVTRVAAVVLAAGGSRRMGSPKQLLRIDGITLVRRAAETALASRCEGVYVVVGAAAEAVRREVSELRLQVVENLQLGEGPGGIHPRRDRSGPGRAARVRRRDPGSGRSAPDPPRSPGPADRGLRGRRAGDRRLHLRGNRRSTGAVLSPPLRRPHRA